VEIVPTERLSANISNMNIALQCWVLRTITSTSSGLNTPYFTQGYFSANDLQLLGNADSYFQVNNLQLSGNTLVVVPNFTSFLFKFSKELNATDLFLVAARPYFYDTEGLVQGNSANDNEDYEFLTAMDGTIAFGGEHLDYTGPEVYVVVTYINDVPYYFLLQESGWYTY
jgi:hypothetical protein